MYFFSMTLLPILRPIQRPTTQGHSTHAIYESSHFNIPGPLIEASDSITDGAGGLLSKRWDTAMRELFFHSNKKFGKNDQ